MQRIVFRTYHTPRFSELDPYGHMNTKHFFDYIAENRMIGHREVLNLGMEEFTKLPFSVLTRNIEMEFLRPVLCGQTFEVTSWVESATHVAARVLAEIKLSDGSFCLKAKMTLVSVDKKTGCPTAWDKTFLEQIYPSQSVPELKSVSG